MKPLPTTFPYYPLANPKGVKYGCELCFKPAYLQCGMCRVTYYCGIEHQKIDWVGIHEKICLDLASFRKPETFLVSKSEREKDREKLQQKNLNMVRLTQLVGQKLLFQGKPEEAVPAALQCLRFTVRAFGIDSIELVSPYLILAESSIGLGKLAEAETYLAQAQWIVLKAQRKCPNAIRSQLHRKLGLLYAVKGDYELALESLAKDVFYASSEYGTDHIRTAGGYFQMAEVFYAMYKTSVNKISQGQNISAKLSKPTYTLNTLETSEITKLNNLYSQFVSEEKSKSDVSFLSNPGLFIQSPTLTPQMADDLYARVVNIWAAYLRELIESSLYEPETPDGISAVAVEITRETKQTLDDAQKAEAEKMLYAIEKYRNHRISEDESNTIACNPFKPDTKVQLYLALSMLNYVLGRRQEVSI
ncbi:Zinc finger MYND domain-containing protein 12 [Schistosoma japonicum]|nr:Zinc finger MYND domain-containing protein 12 [Schistosoma japonicum]